MTHSTIENIYLDYNSISLRLDSLSPLIKKENYKGIVVVLRGGSFAGMHLAFLTGIPYYFLRYDRKTDTPSWLGPIPNANKLLLVEDFAGLGKTLINCKEFLLESGFLISTLVVCKDLKSASIPNYYCFDLKRPNARFILPWERHLINKEQTGNRTEKILDHHYERTAWDMDGVFLKDVDSSLYETDIQSALVLRSQLPLEKNAPTPKQGDMIITNRDIEDKERTEKWLKNNRINIPVVLRDIDVNNYLNKAIAKWKGKMAVDLGFTHYVESNAEQAAYIATTYPELRVSWWNEGEPINIQASLNQRKESIII